MKKTTAFETRTAFLCAVFIFLFSSFCFSQKWHAGTDTLRLPPSPGGFYPSIGALHDYDTVAIMYQVSGSGELHHGYKRVHMRFGYYVDDASTLFVFLDEKLRRLDQVSRYYFR